MMGRGPSIQRLRQILNRQEPPRFGRHYIPSTLATREEGPSKSRPAIIGCAKLGRDVHTMSTPETHAALLALYHPMLVEMHEQKMLSRWPSMHPLSGMPGIKITTLPSVQGTINVAERLGYGDLHPYVFIEDPDSEGRKVRVAFPYQGDFLLFFRKNDNDVYCVNWTVKDTKKSFSEPRIDKRWDKSTKRKRKALARHEIEKIYYSDVDIRTQEICGDEINKDLAANLCLIFPDTYHKVGISAKRCKVIVDAFQAGLETRISPCDVITSLICRKLCNAEEARILLYQAIWNRELRIDMFVPILIDHPLVVEKTDVIDYYSEWFKQ